MGEGKSKAAGKVAATALSSNSSAESWQHGANSASSSVSKVALLVGVSEYDSGFAELPGAVKDAKAMQTVLSAPSLGKFDQVLPLLENPDSSQMQQAMYELFANRGENDLVLLYFSGHGFKDINNKLYLGAKSASKDSYGNLIDSSVISASFVHDLMNQCRSKRQVIILDCCFSGAFPQGFVAKDDTSVDLRSQLGGKGRVILSSSGATQLSFSGMTSDLSPYTRCLIEGMCKGKGSVNELHQYVKQKIQTQFSTLKPEIYTEQGGENIRILETTNSSNNTRLLMNTLIHSGAARSQTFLNGIVRRFKMPMYALAVFLSLSYLFTKWGCQTLNYKWRVGGPNNSWVRARYHSTTIEYAPEAKVCDWISIPITRSR